MPIRHLLTDADIASAIGVSKIVIKELLQQTRQQENKGAVITHRSNGNQNMLCLIHGFSGDAETTFGSMPELITSDDSLLGWDLISIGYSTELLPDIGKGLWSADPDINKIAGYLRTYLQILFSHYNRIALVGHSMGGLVIQRAMLNMADIQKISHVLLYGTPSGGLKKAMYLRWLKNQIRDMDKEGPFIASLRKEWTQKFEKGHPFSFAVIAGESDEFVPPESSLKPFPEEYHHYTSGNHTSMVKPVKAEETSFLILKKHLNDAPRHLFGDDRDVSNLIAQYHKDVQTLGPKLNELDAKGFKKYIFALEGIGRIEGAVETLEKAELLQHNTDCMGILGGRYKRKYLLEQTKEPLEKAIYWYEKALRLSEQAAVSSQIYYHAINLAFLYLMRDETQLQLPRQLADLAVRHCALDESESFWKDATKAEAYLYLGDFDKSKALYASAIAKSGNDIRVISSMRLNALYACNSLHRADWADEMQQLLGD